MPKKQETASGWPPSRPEVAVTLRSSTNVAAEINLSVEDEISQLRERNHQLEATVSARDAEIASLKADKLQDRARIEKLESEHHQDQAEIERLETNFISFFKFCVEALEDASKALEAVQPGRETRQFLDETKKGVETASPEGRPYTVIGRIRQIITKMKETPPIVMEPEEESGYTYSLRTRTENRAMAIVDHLKRTGKASLKSTEARAVLETHEGKPLDRKVVLRALEVARGVLRATSDKVGGVTRLILSTSSRRPAPASPQERESHNRIGGGGGGLSRPRAWAVPWDGSD